MSQPSNNPFPNVPTSSIRLAFGPQAELILERLDGDIVQLTLVARTSFGWEMLGRQTLSLEQLQELPFAAAINFEPQHSTSPPRAPKKS
jgi:hypothetical protein